jgi:ABC-2 type transport system permease protein
MRHLTGTRTLVRLAVRLDRVRLSVWVLALALLPIGTAAQYRKLYPDDDAIRQVAGVVTNPSLEAVNGPLFSPTLGGLTAWKILATELILVALMSLLTVLRHTRADEEAGRLELVRAGAVGRHAPLTAALVTAALAGVAAGVLVALALAAAGLPAGGAVTMGSAVTVTGLVFAAIAAGAAQLTSGARTATAIAAAVLGASYLLRAAGDTGTPALTWASPIGWGLQSRPFAGDRWAPLVLGAGAAVVLGASAYLLAARRDLGAGLLPQRPGPATAAPGLRSPLALAWRLHRGILAGWIVGMVFWGATLGGAATGLGDLSGLSDQVTELLTRMGGTGAIVDAYLAAVFGITGLVAAAYTVQATLRLRAEESADRLEPLLATGVTRTRWMLSHLVFALAGTAVLLAVAGASAGLVHGLQMHDVGGQLPRLTAAAAVQLPAAWILAGVGAVLFGLAPRLASATWAALVACLVLLEVGALFEVSRWLVDVSPFAHVPKLPGAAFAGPPLGWLTAVGLALVGAGLMAFRRRDAG